MIFTFQRNWHFRKVSGNKTFTFMQIQKKRCHRDIPLTFRLVQNRLKEHYCYKIHTLLMKGSAYSPFLTPPPPSSMILQKSHPP